MCVTVKDTSLVGIAETETTYGVDYVDCVNSFVDGSSTLKSETYGSYVPYFGILTYGCTHAFREV